MADLTFKANLLPNTDLGKALGSSNQRWNIYGELVGNASSATKLQTARNINGTAFDGTVDITTAHWGTARNISISDSDASNTGAAVSVNGSAAVTLKLPATIKATLKGNADTATKATQDQNGLRIDTGYLKLTGGRMTGNITMRTNSSMSTDVIPSTNTNFNRIQWEDKDGYSTGGLGNRWYTDGTEAMEIYEAKRKTDGTYIYNQMALGFKSDNTPYVWLGQPATWRTALGLGARATDNTAYLPLTGGTMTGALNTANDIWNVMGDDSQIGDINEAGTLGLQGRNGNTAIRFTTYNQSNKTTGGKITWDGNNFIFTNLTQSNMIFPYHEVTSFNANSATSGIYSCKCSVTNAPVTNHGVLIDFHFVGTPFQIFMPDNINYMYKRWYTSGAWTAWKIMNAAWA